ncbi:MAG: Type 1 glutamine amidotransferase-like domain-containing protein [Bacteroidales bacterium]|nr:Type 1 glutamine amidotransferase-like domain-containing protein [Bacteroidales bacterium]
MTLILTGSPTRYGEDRFTTDNGFLATVKAELPPKPRILMISAAPDDRAFTDSVLEGMTLCVRNSGIKPSGIVMLDRRNAGRAAELIHRADWVVLCGGHVPTQNRFIHEIGLRRLLEGFQGLVMGCSAGSMNCAGMVYSHPELPGEAADPGYSRWLKGLGLTDIRIIPHYHQVRNFIIDGRRLFEDIIFPDSFNHSFYTFPDGGYILSKDGRTSLFGTAWEISGGQMRQICSENQVYTFMNVVFISPHFPQTYSHFCAGLKANGVNVLGIADAPHGELTQELRGALTDYYQVRNLEDYDEVYRAVAWFAHRYGHIDWIESNNEYWLEQDARLRTDFNVTSGLHTDRIAGIKEKSEMKKSYAAGHVPTARQIKASEGLDAVLAFARKTGYPIIAKPDNGVGASGTFKLGSDEELRGWFGAHQSNYGAFVVEEFITGLLTSYDAIYNSKGEPIFESMGVYPTPIMDIVHGNLDSCYWVEKDVPAALSRIGRRTVKAFGVTRRFVHLEFFKLDRDREGLGKKGDFVGLEVNMRPAGGYTPDMMNFAHSTDVYQIWADMVAFDERRKGMGEQYFCAYASRRDCYRYVRSNEEIFARYGSGSWSADDPALGICMCRRMPDALSDALGNQVYVARFASRKDIQPFFDFVCEKA